jgi:hypothetical protein
LKTWFLQSLNPVLDCVLAMHSQPRVHAERRLTVLWSTDDDERTAALFAAVAKLSGVTIVRIEHDGPSDRFDKEPMLAMADAALLGEADDDSFIGTSRSSFSFVAHARALLRPRFVGHMRPDRVCVPGASTEGGLVSIGDMHAKCERVRLHADGISYSEELMRCKEKTRRCVSLGPGGFIPDTFLENRAEGYCLQDLLRSCLHVGDGVHEQQLQAWAGQFDVGIDARSILEYRWNRDGSPILRTMYPHAMRSCAEVRLLGGLEEGISKRVTTALRPFDNELVNDTNTIRELRTKNALQYQNLVDRLDKSEDGESDSSNAQALQEEIAAMITRQEDEELRLQNTIELNVARRRRYTEFWGIESELELHVSGGELPADSDSDGT